MSTESIIQATLAVKVMIISFFSIFKKRAKCRELQVSIHIVDVGREALFIKSILIVSYCWCVTCHQRLGKGHRVNGKLRVADRVNIVRE